MKKIVLALVGLGLMTAACTATKDNQKALPKGSDQFPAAQNGAVETTAPTTAPAAVKVTTTTAAPKASACDVVREAFLTGTPAELEASLKALVADKTADATAREYADYWLHRDAPPAYGSKDLRSMDATLIKSACS